MYSLCSPLTVCAVYVGNYVLNGALVCIEPVMAVNPGSKSEPMIGDLSRIVTEGFTILENSVHKIIFVK